MEIVEIPSNVNVMAVPTSMLPLRVGKKNDAYIFLPFYNRIAKFS